MPPLSREDADRLDDLAERTERAVRTAEETYKTTPGSDRTARRLLWQIQLYGQDLARSARELAEHVRARPLGE